MHGRRYNILQAKEKIKSAIPNIEHAQASTYKEHDDSEPLEAVLLHLQDSVTILNDCCDGQEFYL